MIPKRQFALAVASFFALSGAGALAQTQSDRSNQAGAASPSSNLHRTNAEGDRARWNRQAGDSRDSDMYPSREERWRRSDRARAPSDWDALGEFDSRSDDRSGRFAAGPGMWRNLDEGSGYTYRERYYQPDASRRHYTMDRERYRDPSNSMRDRERMRRDRRDMADRDYEAYSDRSYYEDRQRARQMPRGMYRDRYSRAAPRDSWREGRAVGPQGWRGDMSEGMIAPPMSSLYGERGAVGPQGWQPGMTSGAYTDSQYRTRGQ